MLNKFLNLSREILINAHKCISCTLVYIQHKLQKLVYVTEHHTHHPKNKHTNKQTEKQNKYYICNSFYSVLHVDIEFRTESPGTPLDLLWHGASDSRFRLEEIVDFLYRPIPEY